MNGTDDEVEFRGVCQQFLHVFRRPFGIPQFYPQPQLDLIAHRRLRRAEIPGQKRPVVRCPQLCRPPLHGFHMVGKADLVQPGPDGRLSHGRHGILRVRGKLRVGMIIRQIHTVPHFLNFLKNFLRSS